MLAQPGEVAREVGGRGEAVFRVLLQAAVDEPAQRRGRARVEPRHVLGLLADDGGERLRAGRALERTLPRRHLVEDGAERELVGAEVERAAARLLGRHVADRAEHDTRPRVGRGRRLQLRLGVGQGRGELGETEVEDLDEAVLRDHHVLGLEVPVHDPRRVGLGEPVRELRGEVQRLARGERAARDQLAQRAALDELHGDVAHAVVGADVEERDDVGVVERRGGARLLLEARATLGIGRDSGRQDLDRDLAPEPRVAGAEHLAHASRTDGSHDLIRTEPGARREGHLWTVIL